MSDLREKFWDTVPLDQMTNAEWEALCDGCGKCCLNKIENEDDGRVFLTSVACCLFDDQTCRCRSYETRHDFVPECIVMSQKTIAEHAYWMPRSCAYRRLYLGEGLPDWHPLKTGDPNSVHDAGVSLQGQTVSEEDIHDDDWEDHIIGEVR